MIHDMNLVLVLVTGFAAAASPGPAMVFIAHTSITSSRARGLALLFSNRLMVSIYARFQRWFEGTLATARAFAGIKF